MLRYILFGVLSVLIVRAFWRLVGGVLEGSAGRPGSRAPLRGVHMVRDPVCGTYVVPERAVTLAEGRRHVSFCSTACRDKYRARSA
jgi:YHS domain-containing protein